MTTSLQSTKGWLRDLDRRSRNHIKARNKIIKKLAKRKHTLGLIIKRKLELNQELSENERAYILRPPRGQRKNYVLSRRKHGLLDSMRIAGLHRRGERSPTIMFRSTTTTGTRHTNGFTTPNLFIPSAYLMRDFGSRKGSDNTSWVRPTLTDIQLQELRPMLGQRLLWQDRIQDELLSWTVSYVFAIVHLYLRHLNGEGIGCVSMINRNRALHPGRWYVEQQEPQPNRPAKFYSANDLCDSTGVYHDHEWACRKDLPGLHPRKTNHEYISHGVVEYPDHDRLQQAIWSDLVTAGLFELVPELKVCFCSRVAGLYTVLRYIRTSNYNDTRTTTHRELEIVQEIAWLHTRLRPGEEKEQSRPNLWILLYALTFHKRTAGDPLLQKLIRRLGYTRQDLDENLYPAFGVFPANLPEMQSLYHLAVDVQAVVGGEPLRALVLTGTYSRVILPPVYWGRDDTNYDKTSKPRLIESKTDEYEITHRCGLPCDCSIWNKRKKAKRANHSDHSEDADEPKSDGVEVSIQAEIQDEGQIEDVGQIGDGGRI